MTPRPIRLTSTNPLPPAIAQALRVRGARDDVFGDRDHGAFRIARDAHFERRHDGPSNAARASLRSHHGRHAPLRDGLDESSDAGRDGANRDLDIDRVSHALGLSSHALHRHRERVSEESDAGERTVGGSNPRSTPRDGDDGARLGGARAPPFSDDARGDLDQVSASVALAFDPDLFARRDEDEDECHAVENADVWAEPAVGVTANGALNAKQTAGECCAACAALGELRCNLWTWSPETHACFLKRGATPYQPLDRRPGITLTAGAIWPKMPKYDAKRVESAKETFSSATETDKTLSFSNRNRNPISADPSHVPLASSCITTMITSNGQPYMNWQTRVFYQTWLEAKKEPGSPLVHFTRVLHRTRDDELVREIPTVRIDPTHPECDNGCDYAVKDRARAIATWATTPDARRCSHVLMAEADYLMVRSPPPSVMLQRGHTYGFLFGYIIPWHADAMPASERLAEQAFGTDPTKWPAMESVPQSGNAPQVVHADDLAVVAPAWADSVEFGESDPVVKRVFGWVRDMYAFDFAARKVGVTVHYPPVPLNKLMVQPPADTDLGAGCLMHYTWSPILSDKSGRELWKFDKRSFRGGPGSTAHFTVLEQQTLPPPWDEEKGFKLQAGEAVTEPGLALMRLMAETFNKGVAKLTKFPEGTRDAEDVRRVRQEGW